MPPTVARPARCHVISCAQHSYSEIHMCTYSPMVTPLFCPFSYAKKSSLQHIITVLWVSFEASIFVEAVTKHIRFMWLTQTHTALCPNGLDLNHCQDCGVHCSHRRNLTAFPFPHHSEASPWADETLGPVVSKSSQLIDPDWDDGIMPGPVVIIWWNCHQHNLHYRKYNLFKIMN